MPRARPPTRPLPVHIHVHQEFGLTGGGGEGAGRGGGGGGPSTAPANSSGPKVTTKQKTKSYNEAKKRVTTNPATPLGSF